MVKSDVIHIHYNFTGRLDDINHKSMASNVAFIIMCCFIILANALVLLTIWRTKRFHKPMFYFIGNLAFSDMLAGAMYITNILLSGPITFELTSTGWFIREGSTFVALTASIFSLLAIAVERHLTMFKMNLHSAKITWRIFLLIGTCWIIAAILGSMPIMGWNCIDNLTSCSTLLPLFRKSFILFCISIFTLILIAVVMLYVRIYVMVRSRSDNFVFNKDPASQSNKPSEKSMALLKTVVIVLSCFITCWAPLFILFAVDVVCEKGKCSILHEMKWFLSLAVLNSAINPLIYTVTCKQMRSAFFRLFVSMSCMWPKGKSVFAVEVSHSKSDSSSHNKDKNDFSSHDLNDSSNNILHLS